MLNKFELKCGDMSNENNGQGGYNFEKTLAKPVTYSIIVL